ncbi:MAG: Rpn family recombination-promoting nuclease/putative transposase [Desulfobacterales bacterium]|nr:Rpn family recombination-promoting nuclease/putative transposase [Desulfobacterales bacterium]
MEKLIRFDWAMKKILRDKANFDVLEGFLSALLNDDNIKILHLIESESNQEEEKSKFNRVDLMIEDRDKRKIIIEIQNSREADYLERLVYGTSKVIVENIKIGEDYKEISKVISISILYFNLGIGDDYIYYGTTDFKGVNTGNPLVVRKRIEWLDENLKSKFKLVEKKIFPEYYLIQVERYQNVIKKAIDEWIYMIKNNEVKEGSKSRNIDKAKEKLSKMNMTKEQKAIYERYVMNMVIERDVVNTAKEDGIEIGEKRGIEIGKKEGIEIGKKEGIEIGKKEGVEVGETKGIEKEKKNIAESMILKNMPDDLISELTKLTSDEIKQLKDNLI